MNASPISGKRAGLLVSVCALAMLALLVLYAFAPDLRPGGSDDANVLSRSAVGFAGMKQLLDASGIPTRIDSGDQGQARPSLTILTPGADTDPADLAAYPITGPTLVILPKWLTVPLPAHPGWVQKFTAIDVKTLNDLLARSLPLMRITRTARKPNAGPASLLAGIDEVQTVTGGRVMAMARGYGPLLTAVRRGRGEIFVFSEPDLLNNRAWRSEALARDTLALMRTLRVGNGPVAFDITLNGLAKTPSLLRAAFAPPFLGATLCALFTALLIGLHAATRFGAALVPPRIFARGKKALADNSAALVKMMGREGAMASRYVAAARGLALERLGARRATPAQQQALLDTLARGGESYDQLAAEAAGAKTGGDLLTVARKTFAWRRRIDGGY
jgi:hypothetical protein